MISKDGLTARIREQLLRVPDSQRRAAIQSALVEPQEEVVEWANGDMPAAFRCWIFAFVPERDLELAYCDPGSGPPARWGALLARGRFQAQSEWYESLDRAFDAHFGDSDEGG